MLPIIALVGRPNVGKSTLFNYLTRTRDALVADYPGLTRDRQYGFGKRGMRPYLVVDTGGLSGEDDGIDGLIAEQVKKAIAEADVVLFLTDGRAGANPADINIAKHLRRLDKPVYLTVNKAEGLDPGLVGADFYQLGLGDPLAISAAHGDRVSALMDHVLEALPEHDEEEEFDRYPGIRVAVIGRPNAGKSTLINRMLGEERLVASDIAGTTRDSVFVPFERDGEQYTLIDTAGVRRRSRIDEAIEKFSVSKTLQAIDAAHVVIALLDAHEEIAEQDARLIGLAIQRGRALLLAINKWDGINREVRQSIKDQIERKLPFTDFAPQHFISALHGSGVGKLYDSIKLAYNAAMTTATTKQLTDLLETALMVHSPPSVGGRRVRLRLAHQGGKNPPVIVIHGNQTSSLPASYRRYLVNYYRKALKLHGTPVRIELRDGKNPYEGRKNTLTDRQVDRKRRFKKITKKRARK